jgi:methionyl-tRNA synthetase
MPENFTTFLVTHQWILILAALWTIPWKGVALWRAARNRQVVWFIAVLIFNTLAILEIIYIFYFSKKNFASNGAPSNGTEKFKRRVLDIKSD